MNFDDDMKNRFASQTPTVTNIDAGAAAAASSATRRTAAARGIAAIAFFAFVGLGALALTSNGDANSLDVAGDPNNGSGEAVEEGEGQEPGADEEVGDPLEEERSDEGTEVEPEQAEQVPDPADAIEDERVEEEPIEDEPPAASALGDGVVFRVTNVESDDHLNVRAGPGTAFDTAGLFLHDATGIVRTGTDSTFVGSSEWVEVHAPIFGSGPGWVNAAFLEPADLIDSRPCVFNTGEGSTATNFENAEGSANSDAVIMSVLGTYRYGSCIRTVIEGLDGFSSSNDPAGTVTALPNDISIVLNDRTTEITFGTSILGADQAQARFAQPGLSDPGGVSSSTFLYRPQGVDAPFSGVMFGLNTQIHVEFDNETGRIIIDMADMGEQNRNVGPLLDEGSIVFTDTSVSGTTVSFTGFARPFEANLGVQVLSGITPIEAIWTGGFITEPTTSNGVMTTDWSSGWGIFDFSIQLPDDANMDDVVVLFDPSGGAADDPEIVEVRVSGFIG